jgi:hypothetical protein
MSAETAVQDAVVATLRASAPVAALVEARVYDRIPDKAPYPFIHFGETQAIEDDTDCGGSAEVFVTLHVWSNAVGAVQARLIAAAVRAALHRQPLTLAAPYGLTEIEHRDTRVFADTDKTLTHGVVTLRALVEG